MSPTTAQERATEAAKRYLSNIVVIDDRMSMEDSGDSHGLNVDALSRAFAQVDFSCGVYKPTGQQDEADVIAKLILKSDAAVMDWSLGNGSPATGAETLGARYKESVSVKPELCISAIQKVLETDQEYGNPLRLIVIYTAETITKTVVEDLQAALIGYDLTEIVTGEFGLQNGSIKIVFKGKAVSGDAHQYFTKRQSLLPVEDIPNYVIQQYAELAAGLMPPAVLHGLAALREKTGELLGIFSKKLDPAMALHAMLIPDTEEAARFLCELFSQECVTIIEGCSEIHKSLSPSAIMEWISHQESYSSHADPGTTYSSEYLKSLLMPRSPSSSLDEVECKRLLAALYGKKEWWEEARNFCRLCTLRRDPWSDTRRINDGFAPSLGLGSILKDPDGHYMMCIIPPCDAARPKEKQYFPFVHLKKSKLESPFSYAAKDSTGDDVFLAAPDSVSWKKLMLRRFSPAAPNARVIATCNDRVWHFVDADKKRYEWLGDVKAHLALKLASDLAPGLTRIGVNEFDWLRLKRKEAERSLTEPPGVPCEAESEAINTEKDGAS
jgi:hypothetical protein